MSGTNWEKSRALTSLKRDLLLALFRYTREFFLTGGSALGIFYLDHRKSYDLDLFSTGQVDWHKLGNDVLAIALEIGAQIEQLSASPTFRRYRVRRADETEIVDFVQEMTPQIEPEKRTFDSIVVDTPDEIAINKWCTILGRTEIKDVIDLYFLSRRVDIWGLFARAQEKEGGVDPSMLSFLISQMSFNEVPTYMLAPMSLEELRAFVDKVKSFLDAMSFPES